MSSAGWWRGESAQESELKARPAAGSLREAALRLGAKHAEDDKKAFAIFISAFALSSNSMSEELGELLSPKERGKIQGEPPEAPVSYGYDGAPLTVVPELQELEELVEATTRSLFYVQVDTPMKEENLRLLARGLVGLWESDGLALGRVNISSEFEDDFPSGIYALKKPKRWDSSLEENSEEVLRLLQDAGATASIISEQPVRFTVRSVSIPKSADDWGRPLMEGPPVGWGLPEEERLFKDH